MPSSSRTRNATDELAIAEQCDARGAHDEAINALARATRLGDVEATTRLAKRLIVGNDAPLRPKDGTGLLIQAVNSGGAEAAAKLAVLVAVGAYVEQSFSGALHLLAVWAEREWRAARSQLLALTPDRELASAACAGNMPRNCWHRLAESVDLVHWTTAPEKTTLHESPLICAFEDFVPESVCRWIIDRSIGNLKRALVYDAVGGKEYASHTRTNSWTQLDLMTCELTHLLVQARMQAACGYPIHNMEATAVLHYAPGEEISNHFDFVDPDIPNYEQELEKNGQRMLTFLVYLNDDYEGGETEFPELGLVHQGRLGEGLFFVNALQDKAPDMRTVHAGRPPTKGEKWIVSQFVRNRRVLAVAR